MRYELADYEWTAIRPMLPNKPRGVPRVNDRRVLNGILGACDLEHLGAICPRRLGRTPLDTTRFVRWRRAGVWGRISTAPASQRIGQLMGRSRGGLTSKIHALVDSNGLPVRLALSPGGAHDVRLAGKLLSRLKSGSMLLADRGYDAD
ncbi:transposase [Bradyrhizobium sp. 2S1]|nr:transposase [Bradyrhizobium sp. 2S1]MCK7667200.1 transposase [Bradyrhizobium sp. 2S1]